MLETVTLQRIPPVAARPTVKGNAPIPVVLSQAEQLL
jgi:hypothetical protein